MGVLSDSYDTATSSPNRAANDVASGDLPGTGNPCGFATPVQVLADADIPHDEGRAMLGIVHDLAPAATLAFATGPPSIAGFADNVRALKAQGANVIVDDFTGFGEPNFQKGPIDVAIDDVTAQGAAYFTDAANDNVVNGGSNKASFESPAYRPSAGVVVVAALTNAPSTCEDFDSNGGFYDNTLTLHVANGQLNTVTVRVILQWAEPWNGSKPTSTCSQSTEHKSSRPTTRTSPLSGRSRS